MEEGLREILNGLSIGQDSVELERACLKRDAGSLSVTFLCREQLSRTQTDALSGEIRKRFGNLHSSIYFRSPESEAPEPPAAVSEPREPQYQYAAPEAPKKDENAPEVLLGRTIRAGRITQIRGLNENSGNVTVTGRVVSSEEKESWTNKTTGKTVYRFQINLSDDTDSIYLSCSFNEQDRMARFQEKLAEQLKAGRWLLVSGICKLPRFGKEIAIFPNDINAVVHAERQDTYPEKRVELHLHTRMSTMDGLIDTKKAFQTAKRFGHAALAITDHGVVQSFPEAAKASRDTGVKAIYGVEGYLLSDTELADMDQTYVVFDLETTGLKPNEAEIIEIGAVKVRGGEVLDRFQTFVNGGIIIPKNITELTGITNEMIQDAPPLRTVLSEFHAFIQGCCLVAHNADFDTGFIRYHGKRFGLEFEFRYADTLVLSRNLMHDLENHKLDTLCEALNVTLTDHHRAIDDAAATAEIFIKLMEMLKERDVHFLPVKNTKNELHMHHERGKGRQKTNHITILAENQDGMMNLYRLISYSHLDHFRTRPIIPLSMLMIFRKGLIIGSACEQGELYQAVLAGKPEEELEQIASRYDFLEIMPRGNNAFMIREGIATEEKILEMNRHILALGDKLGIPVCATGDAHFLNPEDSIYRQILMMKLGFEDAAEQAPLYFKTTDEMMEEFAYLGEETAHRVVIDAPNAIAARIGEIKPFPDGTHAPKIPDAEKILENMALEKAAEIYGTPLPEVVQKRLDKELGSIIGNGYASLYLMAQRLVWKSNSDGYLVGSRGSVGSSLVATMAGITEVNALQPHYVCPNPECKHSEFDIPPGQYFCGVDMPDKNCPVCGTKYKKMGFEIPFEVFLGFKGDKTPDIDLNFSGEYQPVAHKYVEEMFGRGHAFRAGTISGIAEKKAFECVLEYQEKTGRMLRQAEKERLVNGCLNVKVTTGQHPGGIVIVPKEDDILQYTPVNYPADKKDKNTITTHFDFHAMDDRLVKLDILGHDDPTALRMLQDLTGLNPRDIPLDDPETMSIFSSTDALGIDLKELDCSIGSIGVPEFGTGFVRGVLELTRPKSFEELVRIAGLTHGTDVWLNNAEPLVVNKIAKLNEVLCTRDDIMNYLIAHDMEPSLSFKIMERVRKGKGLTEEMEQALIDGKIPQWFIDSCHKIKYMFPRGHAVAYSMMSFRIAYYKVHYPCEFYAVYYTVRADLFDITLASGGADKVLRTIRELDKGSQNKDSAERKRDHEMITILEVVYEMNRRGIELLPVDIYRSEATRFLVEDGGIRAPFSSIPGVGESQAIGVAENRGTAKFLSIEDFQKRTGANSGVISAMERCGCFDDLPKTNQIALF